MDKPVFRDNAEMLYFMSFVMITRVLRGFYQKKLKNQASAQFFLRIHLIISRDMLED